MNISLEAFQARRTDRLNIAANYGASNIRVFGSVARGEADADSDIDWLVDLRPGRSLFDRIALMQELEDLLACRVDVAIPATLHERIRNQVLRDAVPL